MKRYEQSTALGMWDFAAYVLSEDPNVANNVAHSYLALTLGEDSYMSKSAINTWRGNVEEEAGQAKEISEYIKMLRRYFPEDYSQAQMERVIENLLEQWSNEQKGI